RHADRGAARHDVRSVARRRIPRDPAGPRVRDGSNRVPQGFGGMSAGMSRLASLPPRARGYVVAVIGCGAAALAAAALQFQFAQPRLFAILLLVSIVAAMAKIELPLGRNQSNLSLSQATIFWAL